MGGEADGLLFGANGLIPAIAQDAESGEVLMLAYMNREALARTRETGFAHYYSRSRQRLWKKGEESGHVQRVREIRYDCDGDALLLAVEQTDAACHTGNRSCFYRRVTAETLPAPAPATADLGVLSEVYRVILQRKAHPVEGSYVASLLGKGEDQVLKKIAEEATEVLLASRDGDRGQVVYEMADLWFHTLVLLAQHGIRPAEIAGELARRAGKRKPEYAGGAGEPGPTAPSKSRPPRVERDTQEPEDEGLAGPPGVPQRWRNQRCARQAQERDGEIAEGRHHLRPGAAPDLGAVFVEGDIPHPVQAVLDGPVGADEGEEPGRRGLGRREAGHPVDGLAAGRARREEGGGPAEAEDLADVGKGEVAVQRGAAPDRPGLQAAVGLLSGRGLRGEKRPAGGRRCRRGG